MLRLNLLPPEQKEVFEWEKNRRFVVLNATIFFLSSLFFALLLTSALFYIKIQLEPIKGDLEKERIREETREVESLKAEIQVATEKIQRLRTIQTSRDDYAFLLRELAALPRPGIQPGSIAITETAQDQSMVKNVRVSGHADTRDDLIAFEDAIGENPHFVNLISPSFPNKTKERDIDFTITFSVAVPVAQ